MAALSKPNREYSNPLIAHHQSCNLINVVSQNSSCVVGVNINHIYWLVLLQLLLLHLSLAALLPIYNCPLSFVIPPGIVDRGVSIAISTVECIEEDLLLETHTYYSYKD